VSSWRRDLQPARRRERPLELAAFVVSALTASLVLIWGWRWNAGMNDFGEEAARRPRLRGI